MNIKKEIRNQIIDEKLNSSSVSPYNHSVNDSSNDKVPIKRGCKNKQCFCTGKCQEIIAWRDKMPYE